MVSPFLLGVDLMMGGAARTACVPFTLGHRGRTFLILTEETTLRYHPITNEPITCGYELHAS